jgi:hypothetical protein
MKQIYARIVGGFLAAVLVTLASTLVFSACAHNADDCRNTASCPLPDECIEAGDARDELEGCF